MDPVSAISLGIQGTQAMGSGISGKQAAKQANQRQKQLEARFDPIMGQAFEGLFGENGAFGQMLGGPGLAAGQNLFNRALTEGDQFSAAMGDYQNQLTNLVGGPTSAETQGTQGAFDIAGQLRGMGPQFGFDFSNPAIGAGMGAVGNAISGMGGAMPGMNFARDAAAASMAGPQAYDFSTGRGMQDQIMRTFQEQAAGARQSGMENIGQSFTQSQDALNAALASQGISAGSGVAAGALGDLAMQGANQRAILERDLAAQAGQTALQGAQFDVGAGLQREQMESGYNLGFGGLGMQGLNQAGNLGLGMAGQDMARLMNMGQLGLGQAGLGQDFALGTQGMMSNFELARAAQQGSNLSQAGNLMLGAGGLAQQGDLARTGMQGQNLVNAANMARMGYLDPLTMQQGIYSQNILSPFMTGVGGLQGMLEMAMQGIQGGIDSRGRNAQTGGTGAGNALSGFLDTLNKSQGSWGNKNGTPAPTPLPTGDYTIPSNYS
jgi:hypothetical protein